jgi:hypothetical protein
VLERQVRMTSRRCLAIRHRENDFESRTKHVYFYDYVARPMVSTIRLTSAFSLPTSVSLRLHRRQQWKPVVSS